MELRHLRSFMAVFETGGFRRAAELEFVVQPAITRHVKELERALGVRLFERTSKGAEPTSAGTDFYRAIAPRVRALLAAIEQSSDELNSRATARIGYISPALRFGLPELVQGLQATEPPIAVMLEELGTPAITKRLLAGELDGGFVAGDDLDPRLTVTPITRLEFVIAVPDDHQRSGAKIKLATLNGANLISPVAQEPSHQQLIDAIREQAAITIQDAFGIDTIRSLVGAGLGVSLVPKGSLEPATPGIRLLAPDPPLPSIQVGIATRTADESRQANAVRSIALRLADDRAAEP